MKKRIIKISKLSILLLIRQAWTTVCNVYLLAREPFLTLRNIKAKKDKSQAIALVLIFASPALIYIIARLITDLWWYKRILLSVGTVFGLTIFLEMLLIGYVSYWTYRVILKNHFRDFREKI